MTGNLLGGGGGSVPRLCSQEKCHFALCLEKVRGGAGAGADSTSAPTLNPGAGGRSEGTGGIDGEDGGVREMLDYFREHNEAHAGRLKRRGTADSNREVSVFDDLAGIHSALHDGDGD